MSRFRFNIGSLVILVFLAGVGFAGLREANELWDSGVFTLTLGFLLMTILFAVHRTNRNSPSGSDSPCSDGATSGWHRFLGSNRS